jgi:hypothetical protein
MDDTVKPSLGSWLPAASALRRSAGEVLC